jgi:hypothetical protein
MTIMCICDSTTCPLTEENPTREMFSMVLDDTLTYAEIANDLSIKGKRWDWDRAHSAHAAAVLSHPKCPSEFLRRALVSSNGRYRTAAEANPNLTEEDRVWSWLARNAS